MVEARILADVDWDALHAYCNAYGQFMESNRYLKDVGRLHTYNTAGSMIKSPYVTMRNEGQEQMRKWANELGITPAARARVEAVPGGTESDDNEFFGYPSTAS